MKETQLTYGWADTGRVSANCTSDIGSCIIYFLWWLVDSNFTVAGQGSSSKLTKVLNLMGKVLKSQVGATGSVFQCRK